MIARALYLESDVDGRYRVAERGSQGRYQDAANYQTNPRPELIDLRGAGFKNAAILLVSLEFVCGKSRLKTIIFSFAKMCDDAL